MLPTNQQIREKLRHATAERCETNDGARVARALSMEELPGLVFALVTLAWIFGSLAGLGGLTWKPVSDHVMAHIHQLALQLPPHTGAVLSRVGTVAGIARRAWDVFSARDCA